MVKKIIYAVVVIAIGATVAYQLGWLSSEGEDVYDDTKESVLEQSESIVDRAKDAIN